MKKLIYIILLPFFFSFQAEKPSPKQPNILWITCEDMSEHLGCYGEKVAKTPILNQFASEGIRYTNFYATAGVCAPSRSAIITGMHQQTIGTQHMRTLAASRIGSDSYPPNFKSYSAVVPEKVKCFPEYLRENGYYCTNNSKEDYQFEAPPTAWDESSDNAHWRNRIDKTQPFFSVFNLFITHESQVFMRAKEPLLVKPEDVIIPPYYPDIPEVRKDMAIFLSNVMKMDKQVGKILAELKEDGLLENTIIFFFSDHGDGLPFAKREIYDRGLRVPFMVKFPANQDAQTVDNELHSFVDLAPTVLSLANIPIPKNMQGQVFLGNQKAPNPRKYIYAARDRMDSEYDRVRAVRDGSFKYIKNYMPEKPLYQNIRFRLLQPMMPAILKQRDEGKLNETQMKWFVQTKPKEELYDCQNDYFELNNLADKPEFQSKLKELRKVNENFTKKYGDMGEQNEMEMVSKWWSGKQEPPTTEIVNTQNIAGKCNLSTSTISASIGYKTKAESPWMVYVKPFSIQKGDSLYTIAQRIGYKKSDIRKTIW